MNGGGGLCLQSAGSHTSIVAVTVFYVIGEYSSVCCVLHLRVRIDVCQAMARSHHADLSKEKTSIASAGKCTSRDCGRVYQADAAYNTQAHIKTRVDSGRINCL